MSILTYREALNQAMSEEMRRDETIVLMGEEVGFYNGAYKVSKGMLEEFGPMGSWTRRLPSWDLPAWESAPPW